MKQRLMTLAGRFRKSSSISLCDLEMLGERARWWHVLVVLVLLPGPCVKSVSCTDQFRRP